MTLGPLLRLGICLTAGGTVLAACSGSSTTSTSSAPEPGTDAPWTARILLVTPTSLGAVRLGMSKKQAEQAANATFTPGPDGAVTNNIDVPMSPHGLDHIDCLAARTSPTRPPVVITAEGFRIGASVAQLQRIYGNRLEFFDDQGGYAPTVGYRLHTSKGLLTFFVDGSRVDRVAASGTHDAPPTC